MFATTLGEMYVAFIAFMAMLLLLGGKVLGHVDPKGEVKEAAREGIARKILRWFKK